MEPFDEFRADYTSSASSYHWALNHKSVATLLPRMICVQTLRVHSRERVCLRGGSLRYHGVRIRVSEATQPFTDAIQGFLRSLSIHLQICWQVVPGSKFFWGSMLAGWGMPVLFGSIALARTGVSYRFGDTCHINHDKALQDYWGPLLAFAAVSTILQFATLGYCIRVYIRSLFKDDSKSQSSSGLPSHNGSIRTVTAKQAYRRVQKAIALQWRGIVVVIIIIVNVVFLAVVFMSMDNTEQAVMRNFGKAEPWLSCLVINRGDKDSCLDKVDGLATPEPTVMAVLILMSVSENSSHLMKSNHHVLMWTVFSFSSMASGLSSFSVDCQWFLHGSN